MPLPLGNWKANVDGYEIELQINAPNQAGVFRGGYAFPRQEPFEFDGIWDEASQTITFSLTLGSVANRPQPIIALFKGFLSRTPATPAPGQDVVATLTGFVQVTVGDHLNQNLKATSRRNVFGWFAQVNEVN